MGAYLDALGIPMILFISPYFKQYTNDPIWQAWCFMNLTYDMSIPILQRTWTVHL